VDTDVQIGFNVDYLIKILEVYKSAWIEDAILQINSLNRHDAIRIVNYRSNEKIDITSVLMPLKI
jgi:DNA polymerase III sliding clamp (beta) subunit (PCNA family)